MRHEPILEVQDLRTTFRTEAGIAQAVDGVTFSLRPGETFALVGESGCGKSVTALSILRLVPEPAGRIAGGSVSLRGRSITDMPLREVRRIRGNRISMIFQEPMTALNPVFTVGRQIAEVLRLHRGMSRAEARGKTVDMLDRVGIAHPEKRFHEYPHELSGGMCQRVMIAMALACNPEVLIADEPTTALDVTIQAQILALMRDLQQELGTAILLITHDMGVVSENADRIGVMYAGMLVEEATRADLLAAPAHPYTQLLLRALPARTSRNQALEAIRGTVPKATEFPPGCRFHNRCPFVMPRCRQKTPPAYPAGNDHVARCFLLADSATHRSAPRHDLGDTWPPASRDPHQLRLEIRNLIMHFPLRKKRFGRPAETLRAVDGVDLTVCRGETRALVGESGCGKTTVGNCIVRLLAPTGGSILFHGRNLAEPGRESLQTLRRGIQMIFQDPFSSLNPRLTVFDALSEAMGVHGIGSSPEDRRNRVEALLERVGLDSGMGARYPHEFSGGQRQRIGIARALCVEPELLICDEVTSSLDVSVQAQILNLLKRLQGELGLSYLFITHNLSVVRYLADSVSVMYLGRIVEEGDTADIFERPAHPYTRALLAAIPEVNASVERKQAGPRGDVPSPMHPPSGCAFHPRCPEAAAACARAYPEKVPLSPTHFCRCIMRKRG